MLIEQSEIFPLVMPLHILHTYFLVGLSEHPCDPQLWVLRLEVANHRQIQRVGADQIHHGSVATFKPCQGAM